MWTCPECGRRFGRRRAGHTCAPAMSLQEWLDSSPDQELATAKRLVSVVSTLPDAVIEPVQVGLFIKRTSSFAQLRTATRWTALTIKLARAVDLPAPDRQVQRQGSRFLHTYHLRGPDQLTPELVDLLVEAYELDGCHRRRR